MADSRIFGRADGRYEGLEVGGGEVRILVETRNRRSIPGARDKSTGPKSRLGRVLRDEGDDLGDDFSGKHDLSRRRIKKC